MAKIKRYQSPKRTNGKALKDKAVLSVFYFYGKSRFYDIKFFGVSNLTYILHSLIKWAQMKIHCKYTGIKGF